MKGMIVIPGSGREPLTLQPELTGALAYARNEIPVREGCIFSRWLRLRHRFFIRIRIPANARCELRLPDGRAHLLEGGEHRFECTL